MDIYLVFSAIERLHKAINQKIISELKLAGYEELVPSHGEILFAVLMHGRLTMQGISKLIRRDKSTVTVLVRKLEKLGYLEKLSDDLDSRVYWVRATEKASSFKPVFLRISRTLLDEFYQGYEYEEKKVLINLLAKSVQSLES